MHFYLVGIKGSGMAGLAKYLISKGEKVGGMDIKEYCFTENDLNITIDDFDLGLIKEGMIVICSSAYMEYYNYAKKITKTYLYHEFLATIPAKIKVAVAGTHGKTTTTKMISHLNNVSYIVGDGSGKYVDNEVFVFEACEYRQHFLAYTPTILVISNIEKEHLDFYQEEDNVVKAFNNLSRQSDIVIANGDDQNVKKIEGNIIYYGFNKNNDIQITKKGKKIHLSFFDEEYDNPFYGTHMIYNMTASITVSKMLACKNISFADFIMPKRRMTKTKIDKSIIIDDYAHHPTEIKATLEAINEEYSCEKYVIFQPHTFNRTKKLLSEFVNVLKEIDNLFLTDIFQSKREKEKYDIDILLERLPNARKYEKEYFQNMLGKEMVLIILSAGDIYKDIIDYHKL